MNQSNSKLINMNLRCSHITGNKTGVIFAALFCLFLSCKASPDAVVIEPEQITTDPTSGNPDDSLSAGELANLYSMAVGTYIDTVFTTVRPDTLFIGKHPDLPDLVLPATIQGIPIRQITPEENEAQREYRETTVYLNIAGWTDQLKAEFIFATFFDYAIPQHNLHMNFSRTHVAGPYLRDTLYFEYPYENTIPIETYLKN